jgi:hypothetical protein
VKVDGRVVTERAFLAELTENRARAIARKPPGARQPMDADAQLQLFRTDLLDKDRNRIRTEGSTNLAPTHANAAGPLSMHGPPPTPTPDPCTMPKITEISANLPLDAGETIIVNGCGFGLKHPQSELRLIGNFPPDQHLKLRILGWSGFAITALVKEDTGVRDDPSARLQVVTREAKLSNTWPAPFYAARDVVKLASADVTVQCHPYGTCAGNGATFGGGSQHYTKEAVDSVSAILQNGYHYAGNAWWWSTTGPQSWVEPPEVKSSGGKLQMKVAVTFTNGPTSAELKEMGKWANLSDQEKAIKIEMQKAHPPPPVPGYDIAYQVDVYVIGPAGVPYK